MDIAARPDRAIADLSLAVKLNPMDSFALHDRGVAYYDKHDFEHAITDFEAAIKANNLTQKIPVIFLTAKTDPRSMIEGINVGARFYVTKPFQIDDLLSKIKRALAGR